jgi:hypothetical protein
VRSWRIRFEKPERSKSSAFEHPTKLDPTKRSDQMNRGGEGTRTLDLRLAKPPLFQLSYTPGTTEITTTSTLFFEATIVGSNFRGEDPSDDGADSSQIAAAAGSLVRLSSSCEITT